MEELIEDERPLDWLNQKTERRGLGHERKGQREGYFSSVSFVQQDIRYVHVFENVLYCGVTVGRCRISINT